MNTLTIIQIILAIVLIILILLQKGKDGIEGALGGGFQTISVKSKRRGAEKFLFTATICVSILFVASILFALLPAFQTAA